MLTRKWYTLRDTPSPRIAGMGDLRIFDKKRSCPSADLLPGPAAFFRATIILATSFLIFVSPALRAQATRPAEDLLTVAEQYLLAAANQDRLNLGLPALRLDPVLTRASALHAHEMADHSTISHQFEGEPELADRGSNAGAHFSLISENVGEAPTSVIIHDLWMHSPGHRANLLDPNVNTIGIAIVTRDHQLYAVEDFASTVEDLTLNEQEHTVAAVIAQSGMQVADSTSDARQTCTMATGYAGPRHPFYIMRYTAASLDLIPGQLKTRLASGKYHQAIVGACSTHDKGPFTSYNIAVLLFP